MTAIAFKFMQYLLACNILTIQYKKVVYFILGNTFSL
jgi:hypothetical protein